MKQPLLLAALLAAGVAGAPAHAATHDLVYYPPEGVHMLVDHADGAPWCAATLNLRIVQYGVAAMPVTPVVMFRTAATLEDQCPQAERLRWVRTDILGNVVQTGTAERAHQWRIENVSAVAPGTAPIPYRITEGADWRKTEARVRREQIERAEHNLKRYDSLAQAEPRTLLSRLQLVPQFEPVLGMGYSDMLRGKPFGVRQVVRVQGAEGEDARVDWPYEMRLTGAANLGAGWYFLYGQMTVDPEQRDGEGLPLTRVRPGPTPPVPCVQDGCAELMTPLAVVRLETALPDWSPELARAIIAEAREPLPAPTEPATPAEPGVAPDAPLAPAR